MEALLAALEQTDLSIYFRASRWGYAALNAAHIAGLALLVGSIVPLDLRLMGAWPSIPRAALARVLLPVAAFGLSIAILTGLVLFACQATDYASRSVFLAKMGLIALGVGSALAVHARHGLWFDRHPAQRLARVGAASMLLWLTVLVSGRLIAFWH